LRWMQEPDEDICIVADEKGHEHTWLYKAGLWRLTANQRLSGTQISERLAGRKVRWLSTARFPYRGAQVHRTPPKVRPSEIIGLLRTRKIATRSGPDRPCHVSRSSRAETHYATWRSRSLRSDANVRYSWSLLALFQRSGAEEREKADHAATGFCRHLC